MTQLSSFPRRIFQPQRGKHDDHVDSVSQAWKPTIGGTILWDSLSRRRGHLSNDLLDDLICGPSLVR